MAGKRALETGSSSGIGIRPVPCLDKNRLLHYSMFM